MEKWDCGIRSTRAHKQVLFICVPLILLTGHPRADKPTCSAGRDPLSFYEICVLEHARPAEG